MAFDLLLVILAVRCACPPLESLFNSMHYPTVVWYGTRISVDCSTHLPRSPIAIFSDSLRSPSPFPWIAFFNVWQATKQYSDSRTESASLIIFSLLECQWEFAGGCRTRVLTRTRAKIAVTVAKTCLAGGTSTAILFKKAIQKVSNDSIL